MYLCKVYNNIISTMLVLLFSAINSCSSEFENESNNEHKLPQPYVNYMPRSFFRDLWRVNIETELQKLDKGKTAEEEQNSGIAKIVAPDFNWEFDGPNIFHAEGHIKDVLKNKEEDIINATTIQMLWKPYIKDHRPFPRYFDWREHEAVSPVKDQRLCSACWAFSIIGNIESMNKIYNNKNDLLSVKYLMDCLPNTNGCEHTSLLKAYASIITTTGGVVRADDYQPYNEQKNQCIWVNPPQDRIIHVTGFQRVRQDEVAMVEALVKHGPLSAAINSKSMANYKNNIDEPTEEQCSSDPKELNHAILIVGYNEYVDSKGHSTPYWIIKNSWGSQWGANGYYYLVRGRNACGIANDVSFALVN